MTEIGSVSERLKGKTILVVEDNIISFKLMQAILKSSGLNMFHAENGQSAVDLCKEHPEIDLVIMDIMLPVMDGLTATKLILENRPGLPVIAATANAFSEDREECIQAGCVDYINKPIAFDRLFEMLSKYIKTDG